MTKDRKNPKVDFFFNKAKTWREEFGQLRNIKQKAEGKIMKYEVKAKLTAASGGSVPSR